MPLAVLSVSTKPARQTARLPAPGVPDAAAAVHVTEAEFATASHAAQPEPSPSTWSEPKWPAVHWHTQPVPGAVVSAHVEMVTAHGVAEQPSISSHVSEPLAGVTAS
jgi:hypothetical protein